MDQPLIELNLALQGLPGESVAIPECLMNDLKPLRKTLIPHITLHEGNLDQIDILVIHKGLMHRLGVDLVSMAYFFWTPVFANEVYVILHRKPTAQLQLKNPCATHDHLGSVEVFLSQAPVVRQRSRRAKSAVIVSAYGVGNIGDDLVSLSSMRMLKDIGVSDVKLVGPNVTPRDIAEADVVALGGGGLFYDSDMENLGNYLYPLQEAKRQGKFFVALGVGTQGIKTKHGRDAFSRLLKEADLITVRDGADRDLLLEIAPTLDNVIVGNDMAFYLSSDFRSTNQGIMGTERIALVSLSTALKKISKSSGISLHDMCRSVIRHLKKLNYKVLLALHSEDDREFFMDLSNTEAVRVISLSRLGIHGAARLYAAASLVVTARFHALILSAIFEKPVVSVCSLTGKNYRLLSSGLPSLLAQSESTDDFNLNRLLSKLKSARPPLWTEVERCIAGTISIRQEVARVIGLHESP